MALKKATKEQARLRLAIGGVSGTGKTMSAIKIALGLTANSKRVAVLDTERGSASKYAHLDFDVDDDFPDFDPRRYIDKLHEVEDSGEYGVCVIDSMTHAWSGTGGILDKKDSMTGDKFGAWRTLTPQHNNFVDAILASPLDIIVTLRAKTEYAVEKDSQGKTKVTKLGLGYVQRDGLEFEFDVVGDMDQEHFLTIGKTRCEALDGKRFHKPGDDVAKILRAWLTDGVPMTPRDTTPQPTTGQAWQAWLALKAEYSLTDNVLKTAMRSLEIPSFKEADEGTRWVIVNHIRQAITPAGPPAGSPEPEPAAEPEVEAPTPPPAPVGRRAPVTVPASTETNDILF